MKRFFQLLLAGLFLMVIGFISEAKVISIDDDVGTSEFIDIQQDFEIADQTQFVCYKDYQEVGITPTLISDISLSQAKTEWYKEQMDLYLMKNNCKEITCTVNTGKLKTLNYLTNNYQTGKKETLNSYLLFVGREVIGLVLEPNQQVQNIIYQNQKI